MKYKITCTISVRAENSEEAEKIVKEIIRKGLTERDLELKKRREILDAPFELIDIAPCPKE